MELSTLTILFQLIVLAGTALPFAFGLPWLAVALGTDLPTTLAYGLWPFVLGGLIKAALATGILRAGWAYYGRKDRSTTAG